MTETDFDKQLSDLIKEQKDTLHQEGKQLTPNEAKKLFPIFHSVTGFDKNIATHQLTSLDPDM